MKIDLAAIKLWGFLDDIDTLADMIKPNDLVGYQRFFNLAMARVERRHTVLYSDGHKLYSPDDVPEKGTNVI